MNPAGLRDNIEPHLHRYGLDSISETADGEPRHAATDCPFQAWSVAEVFEPGAAFNASVDASIAHSKPALGGRLRFLQERDQPAAIDEVDTAIVELDQASGLE